MKTSNVTILAVILFSACQTGTAGTDDPGTVDTGDGFGMPDGCVETRRELVGDPSVPADGFVTSADEAIAELAGDWTGSTTLEDGTVVPVVYGLAHDGGPIEAVYQEYQSAGEGMGAPVDAETLACDPYYAFGVVGSVSADPLVSGEGVGQTWRTFGGGTFVQTEAPLAEVTGTASPSFDVTAWDRVTLAATFERTDDTGRLELAWWGHRDAPAAPATSTATATTGTASPDGTSEWILTVEGMVR